MKLNLLSTFFLLIIAYLQPCSAQSTWDESAQHPSFGLERAFSFEIDGIVYVGTGRKSSTANTAELWAYDITTGNWTPKADFGGGIRRNAVAFSANGYGYAGLGYDGSVGSADFWRYDPNTDTWTQLADFPGGERSHALGLSNGDKGYIVAGIYVTPGGSSGEPYYNDLWEFDGVTETWTELSTFSGEGRWRAYGWVLDNKIYIGGGGRREVDAYQDLYCYDLITGTWEEKTPAPTAKTLGGFSFAVQNMGFFIEGAIQTNIGPDAYGQRVFRYEPTTDTWEEDAVSFIGETRVFGISETVENQVVLGTGRKYGNSLVYYNDMYIFTPEIITNITEKETPNFNIYPNPVSNAKLFVQGNFTNNNDIICRIYDIDGRLQFSQIINANNKYTISLDIEGLPKGIYQLEMIQNKQISTQKFIKL